MPDLSPSLTILLQLPHLDEEVEALVITTGNYLISLSQQLGYLSQQVERLKSNLNRITSVEVPSSTDLCRSNCVDVIAKVKWSKNVLAVGYARISSSAPRPLGAAYVPILLSEVEQERRPSGSWSLRR